MARLWLSTAMTALGLLALSGSAWAQAKTATAPAPVRSLPLKALDLTPIEGRNATQMVDWTKVETAAWLSIFEDEARSRDRRPELASSGSSAWFKIAPRTSLIARDWGESRTLAGTRLSTTESLRLTRSSRMLITRFELGRGQFSPFVQLGLGQWRTDPNLLPTLPRNTELAAHGGVGFDIEVMPRMLPDWRIGVETTLTWLYREVHEPQNIDQTKIVGVMAASKFTF